MTANEAAVEIIRVYMARGLRDKALRAAVGRHANVLRSLDPDVAEALEATPLRSVRKGPARPKLDEKEWYSA